MPAFSTAAHRRDYTVKAGASFYRQWQVTDKNGAAIDLTDGTVDFHVDVTLGGVLVVDLSSHVTVSDGPSGTITMDAPPSAMSSIDPGDYVFDMKLSRSGPIVDYIVTGEFCIQQAITT